MPRFLSVTLQYAAECPSFWEYATHEAVNYTDVARRSLV